MNTLSAVRATGSRLWRRLRAAGSRHYCEICGSHLDQFLPHGDPVRAQSVCPVCYSRERHRLAWSFIDQRLLSDDGVRKMLHLAPEPSISRRLRRRDGIFYVSGDIHATDGIRLDVQRMPFGDGCFDFVYCSHVLNMVRDDVAALKEIGRVMHPTGLALVQVPLAADAVTVEAMPDWTADRRLAEFRDRYMWRRHGADVVSRLEASGLHVERMDWAAHFHAAEFARRGLIREDLLLCHHRETAQ